jgi:hypothetical protein
MKTKETKQSKITEAIRALEVGQSFDKTEFVASVWGTSDYFIKRSFDVFFDRAKKELPERQFKTQKGFVIRIQ